MPTQPWFSPTWHSACLFLYGKKIFKGNVMDNSIYVALSKQTVASRHMEVIANNIANSATSGYKAESMFFHQYLIDGANGKTNYVEDLSTFRDMSQGNLTRTGNPMDIAIQGDGMFAVSTPQGERYTRAGNFTINDQGELSTMDGYQVLDDAGQPIAFEDSDDKITFFANGKIEVDGEERGSVGVYNFNNPKTLKKESSNLFSSEEVPVLNEEPKVVQGMLEDSNVKPIVEMTNLIDVQRDFERTAKFIQTLYDLQENSIQKLAKE
jgi:flagellar basal-body rod protein FlgF